PKCPESLVTTGSPVGAPVPTGSPVTAPPVTSSASAAPPKKPDASPRVSITIEPAPTGTVDVDILASADPAALQRWSIAVEGAAAAFQLKAARDTKGPVEARLSDAKPGEPLTISLARPPAGDVHISYTVNSRTRPVPALPTVDADPNRFMASGD